MSIFQEDVIIFYVHVPNDRGINYMKKKLIELKGEVEYPTKIIGDYNTPLSVIDRTSSQTISKDLKECHNTIGWNNRQVWNTYLMSAEYTFLSSEYGTLTKAEGVLGCVTNHTNKNNWSDKK